jgi:uroporphyrinogen-III decarboxylase
MEAGEQMNSRDRVLTTFAHAEPDRVPLWFGMSPEFQSRAQRQLGVDAEGLLVRLGDDFRRVYARYTGPAIAYRHAGATSRTPFGVERHGLGYGQPIASPLANATLREVHEYAWPDPAWMDVSQIRGAALEYRRQYAVLGGDWSPYWHDAIDLLGMEGLLLKMHDEPEVVDAVLQHVVDYYCAVSQRVFDAAADALDIFFIGNDFGSQCGPLVGPAAFARFLLPHLERLIRLGHDYGLKVQLHCCGGFAPLIPQMIAAGLDALHAVQPSCVGMDLAQLKAAFGRQMVFNGAIDSHHVLIRGTPETVRRQTREVLAIMMPGGGYVAGASHDYILEETPVENVVAMADAVREFGVY